ncbi:MAG TPA: arylesterase [Terracidiphilus sp.]|nr:arylesterase [Terracidiphilus sp.]
MDVRRAILVAIILVLLPLPFARAAQPLLVCYGDSITAGLGLPYGQSYPDDLQKMLNAEGYHYTVRNLGSSGATTTDALANLPNVLRLHPAIVILEFGGNDGLRGLPLARSSKNLDQIIAALQNARIRVLLAGITLPANYGQDYIRDFNQIFRTLAANHHIPLVPMIYKNLVNVPGTLQPDGIHPTEKGAKIVAETIWPTLKPLLGKP